MPWLFFLGGDMMPSKIHLMDDGSDGERQLIVRHSGEELKVATVHHTGLVWLLAEKLAEIYEEVTIR